MTKQNTSARTYVLGAVAAVAYVTLAVISAGQRPLWYDELFTYYVGSRPTFHDVWQSLLTGAEQTPPFFFVIIRASISLFGLNEVALRLPEIAGVGVAALCVWLLVSRRAPADCAAGGTFFFLATSAYDYAYEARAYGLLLAFSGVALVCWQRLGESNRLRPLALCGLGASLAAALQIHYYGVLILAPIGAAQLTRDYLRKRIDIPVWLSVFIAAASLLLLTPQIQAAKDYATTFWALPTWLGAFQSYLFFIRPRVIILAALAMAAPLVASQRSESRAVSFRVPLDEAVAMAGLAILPFAAVVIGKTITGAYTPRYALPAVIGLAVLAGWGVAWLTERLQRPAFIAALLLLGCFMGRGLWLISAIARERDDLRLHSRLLEDVNPNLPIAIGDALLYFKLAHYAPPPLAKRLYYLADQKIAVNHIGSDTMERGLIALSEWAPLRVANYSEFTQSHTGFLVYGHGPAYAWLLPELVKDTWRVSIVKVEGDKFVLRADAQKRQ